MRIRQFGFLANRARGKKLDKGSEHQTLAVRDVVVDAPSPLVEIRNLWSTCKGHKPEWRLAQGNRLSDSQRCRAEAPDGDRWRRHSRTPTPLKNFE